ncbi:MAG TPA: DMT family transporter [Burkholderiales bacterium]|jgi:drug/metabolite transporter (DMT)-like permease
MSAVAGLPLSTPERVRGGILLMLACSMIFASLDATAKFMGMHYPVLQIVWFRYTFHVLGMLAIFVPVMGREMFRATNLPWQVGRGLILVACTCCSFTGLRFMPLAEFTAISFVTPLLVTLFAGPMLGEKVSTGRWVAVGVGFIGVVVLIRPGSGLFGWPALIPLGMAVIYAMFQVLTRKYAGTDNPITTMFFSGLAGAILATFAAPFVWKTPEPIHWPILMFMGVMGGGGHLILMLCFRRAPASVLAPFSYAQLAFATLIGILFFEYVPDRFSLLGMGIIACAGLYAVALQALDARRARRRPADEADVPMTD